MDEELLAIIEAISKREKACGISVASRYVKNLAPCTEGDVCTNALFEFADVAQWEKSLEDSESQLVYRNDECTIENGIYHPSAEDVRHFGDKRFSANKITDGAIMDFEAVITTSKKDRDNDILEAKGADLDPKMPLLWHHIPMMPIGKLVEITQQNSKRVKGHFAIANTPLGKDAAVLVEFGALRISHGFKPLKFSRLEKEEDEAFAGWHIEKFLVMETSLVSVPANDEAVVLAHSRGKLTHPVTKSWADRLREAMPKKTSSGWTEREASSVKAGVKLVGDNEVELSLRFGEKTDKKSCDQDSADDKTNQDRTKSDKSDDDADTKDARLTKRRVKLLKDAVGLIEEAIGHSELTDAKSAKALLGSAKGNVSAVVAAAAEEDDDGKADESIESKLLQVMVAAKNGDLDWQTLHDAKEAIEQGIEKDRESISPGNLEALVV